jgi:ParB/RepB/Spo0J family partition protein
MKLKISKIDEDNFIIRESLDPEQVKALAESLKADGQWNPIIVRPKEGGRYELIAGHYRVHAAKEAGLDEIEATVRDLTDEDAHVLALKTNLLRQEMTLKEQGLVISRMMEKYGWNQTKIAKLLGMDPVSVGKRIRVALNLHETVSKALDAGKINAEVANIIGTVELALQPKLMKAIISKGITQAADVRRIRNQFLNNTIYTLGYQERDISDFVKLLKENGIVLLVDVRYSAESQYKPEFNKKILAKELERAKIGYEHIPELGLPHVIQIPYKNEKISHECVKQWYSWSLEEWGDLNDFISHLKESGKSALMCMERHAKPKGAQKIWCHRDMLADLILEHETSDPLLQFSDRIDL